MSGIFTNVNALRATNALVNNGRTLSLAMQQLSTGKRINSAADDSAGLAMSCCSACVNWRCNRPPIP